MLCPRNVKTIENVILWWIYLHNIALYEQTENNFGIDNKPNKRNRRLKHTE